MYGVRRIKSYISLILHMCGVLNIDTDYAVEVKDTGSGIPEGEQMYIRKVLPGDEQTA
jgi:hypothetical protein